MNVRVCTARGVSQRGGVAPSVLPPHRAPAGPFLWLLRQLPGHEVLPAELWVPDLFPVSVVLSICVTDINLFSH